MHFSVGILFCIILNISIAKENSIQLSSLFLNEQDMFECNQKGYLQYLGKWSLEEKPTSRNPASPEFKQRLEYFIDSCMKIHDWNSFSKYPMDFTFYADWHPEEFEAIASTS